MYEALKGQTEPLRVKIEAAQKKRDPDAQALADTIAAVEAGSPAGDADQCPTIGKEFPYYSGERSSVDDDSPYSMAYSAART